MVFYLSSSSSYLHLLVERAEHWPSLVVNLEIHISDAYNILSTKYDRGLHFVLAGDTNDLKLDSILSLSPSLVQIVQDWTRMDPPAMLDPIIMTLSHLYQKPVCLDPLDADPDKNGKRADIIE